VFSDRLIVVKEGRILNLVSGYRRSTLVIMICDEKPSVVDKRYDISNLELIRDMVRIIKSEELLL
jgi:hypothetical protein